MVGFSTSRAWKPVGAASCPGWFSQSREEVEKRLAVPVPSKESAMSKQWSVEQIVAALEAEVAVHRERSAYHAQHEAFHREKRSQHETALEAASRRLEELRAVSAAALELVGHRVSPFGPPDEGMDIGPASKPRLTLILKTIVEEIGADQHFGPGWLAAEVNRRFAGRLRKPVTTRQMSDACRRLTRSGRLRQVRQGKGRYESRFMRVG